MENFLKRYLKGNATIWIVFILLCLVSILEMYSASSTLAFKSSNTAMPLLRHAGFLLFGVILAFLVHLIPYKYIRLLAYLGLFLSFILLILVYYKGQSANDATRWFEIGGLQFQPSELAKLSVIIVVADFMSRIKNEAADEKKYFRCILIVLATICPLILFENFSTAMLLFGVVFLMMFIGGISIKKLGLLLLSITLFVLGGYAMIKTVPEESMPKIFDRAYTWSARIDRYTEEKKQEENKYVITDENRQVQHGRIAIARGGMLGVMPGNSVERDYLPQAYSDFIYAIIVEEMGLVGGVIIILFYLVLLYRAGRIAVKSETVFPALLVIGLSLMIVLQAFVSMAVATSLGPVTGQPLPLISRGGTSIIITCIYFGIILGVTRQLKGEQHLEEEIPEEQERNFPVVDLNELS
jgi:cell division protein FtsW